MPRRMPAKRSYLGDLKHEEVTNRRSKRVSRLKPDPENNPSPNQAAAVQLAHIQTTQPAAVPAFRIALIAKNWLVARTDAQLRKVLATAAESGLDFQPRPVAHADIELSHAGKIYVVSSESYWKMCDFILPRVFETEPVDVAGMMNDFLREQVDAHALIGAQAVATAANEFLGTINMLVTESALTGSGSLLNPDDDKPFDPVTPERISMSGLLRSEIQR
eukprot:TRINITY_DN13554_c0_g1_i1.p1 TRINITY_DN13554_c0_g1~~TRINITY_DN13554_c0_g1_i1.p1  ORF type:complete len:219 (+),score=25.28 TRINITY_DN13554_c0_g1_i1:58-714(+)